MFDATIQAASIEIVGGEDHVALALIMGLSIPVGQGPEGVIMGLLPAGVIRVALGRDAAIEYGGNLKEAGEALPEPKPESDLVVAKSLRGVDRAAKLAEQFRTPGA